MCINLSAIVLSLQFPERYYSFRQNKNQHKQESQSFLSKCLASTEPSHPIYFKISYYSHCLQSAGDPNPDGLFSSQCNLRKQLRPKKSHPLVFKPEGGVFLWLTNQFKGIRRKGLLLGKKKYYSRCLRIIHILFVYIYNLYNI